jgi:hypothetical protein
MISSRREVSRQQRCARLLHVGESHAADTFYLSFQIFPAISEDRAVITFRPTCLILEEMCKSRHLLSSDVITGVCFLYDIAGKRRISEEFQFKVGVNSGTLVDHRFSTAVFTASQSSLVSSEKTVFLVIRLLNTMNRMVRFPSIVLNIYTPLTHFCSLLVGLDTASLPLFLRFPVFLRRLLPLCSKRSMASMIMRRQSRWDTFFVMKLCSCQATAPSISRWKWRRN